MSDPWQLLILDANTATEKDVKAAYARLLKQHRPDSDPEGFRRVREAYEIALAAVRERDAQGTPPPAYSQAAQEGGESNEPAAATPVFAPPSFELPDAVQPSFSEVERAAASGNAEQLEAALQTFDEACESARLDGTVRVSALERACAGNVKLLATAVSNDLLLRLAEKEQGNLAHLVISSWVEDEHRERIIQFGRAILDHARDLATPEGSMIMARVGVMVGLERPGLASSLGNLAFPHLPVDSRTQIMGQLEHEAALGKAFEEVSTEMKPFWFERLRHANEPHDWQETASMRALDDLVDNNRYTWQGWGIVQQLLPPAHWEQMENRLRNQAQQVTQSAPRASIFPGWLVFPIIVILLNVVRFLGSDASTSRSVLPPSPAYRNLSAPGQEPVSALKRDEELWRELTRNASRPTVIDSIPADVPSRVLDYFEQGNPPPPVRPSPPSVPTGPVDDKKERETYLRALQNGSLFDGSVKVRPPP